MQTVSIPMEQLAQLLELQLENGTAPLTVTGSSMHPMLRDKKDTVYLQRVTAPLRRGELILYRRDNGGYVLHRIVRVVGEGEFLCAGDNQHRSERVARHQVVALVTGFCRAGKEYASDHWGYRAYVWAWVGLFPVRKPFLVLRRRLGRLRRALRQRARCL